MNFQQLRSVREAVRCGFNLTEVAHTLHTSQPGVSRQIRELEDELGIELFVRAGKRLTGLTEPGGHVLPIIERMLMESSNLKHAGQEFVAQQSGLLSVAATHSQARYAMPVAVQEFRAQFPNVKLHLHQGSPKQIAQMLLDGEADVGIATEALGDYPQLVALPCYRWTHSVIVPPGHALLDGPLTLDALTRFPLITYDTGFTGRSRIDEAFAQRGLTPHIVLAAMDADVIKTYVQLGMGRGHRGGRGLRGRARHAAARARCGPVVRHQPHQAGRATGYLPAQVCVRFHRILRPHVDALRGRGRAGRRGAQSVPLRNLEPVQPLLRGVYSDEREG